MTRNLLISAICTMTFALMLAKLTSTQNLHKRAIQGDSKIQLADNIITKDRLLRQAARGSKPTPKPPGFFATIWRLVKDQINDTRSAYSQIAEMLNNQFADTEKVTVPSPPSTDNSTSTTTEIPKLTRAEFLKVLDRNLKGLRRLYDKEVRLAWEDSMKNIEEYKKEARTRMTIKKNK